MSDAGLATALELTAVGLLMVFAVLILIALTVTLIGRLDARWQEREAEVDAARVERPATLDDTTLLLIVAAVATVLHGRHRIRSVRRLLPLDAPSSPWSAQGRAVLMGSHVIRPHRPPEESS